MNRILVRNPSIVLVVTRRRVIKPEEVVADRNRREDEIAASARYDSLPGFISPRM